MPDEKKKAEELKEKLEKLTEEELKELDDEELEKLSGGAILSAESKKLILQKKVALCKG